MKTVTVAAALLILTGCIAERRATFASAPGPLPFSTELQTRPLERTWALGEVFVSVEQNSPAQQAENWTRGRAQIEERLSETLRRQTSVGVRVDDRQSAELIVDVDVRLHETRGINAWFVPALLSEIAILGLGTGIGAGVGFAAGRNTSPEAPAIGSLIGMGIAILPAVLAPLAFPTTDVVGGADAKLTFRRASDGVVIHEKRARSEWVSRHNSYSVEDKLAEITGAGAEALEKELVSALYAGLKASPPTAITADSRQDVRPMFLSDAPRLLLIPR